MQLQRWPLRLLDEPYMHCVLVNRADISTALAHLHACPQDSATTCALWLLGRLSTAASACVAKAHAIAVGMLFARASGTRLQAFQPAYRQRPGLASAEGSGVKGACACVQAHNTPFVLSSGMCCHQVSMHPLRWHHLCSRITLSRQEGEPPSRHATQTCRHEQDLSTDFLPGLPSS